MSSNPKKPDPIADMLINEALQRLKTLQGIIWEEGTASPQRAVILAGEPFDNQAEMAYRAVHLEPEDEEVTEPPTTDDVLEAASKEAADMRQTHTMQGAVLIEPTTTWHAIPRPPDGAERPRTEEEWVALWDSLIFSVMPVNGYRAVVSSLDGDWHLMFHVMPIEDRYFSTSIVLQPSGAIDDARLAAVWRVLQ